MMHPAIHRSTPPARIALAGRLVLLVAAATMVGGAEAGDPPTSPDTSTWFFGGTISAVNNTYLEPIQDRRYQLGMYEIGNRVTGSITFRRTETGPDYQNPSNPDPDQPDDPDTGVYYQVVESMDFQISTADWPGESIVLVAPPPGPQNSGGGAKSGSAVIENNIDQGSGLWMDRITMFGPESHDEVVFDPQTFQQVVIKRSGWDAIPGTRSRVLPVFFVQETRIDDPPEMLDGDHMELELPDVSLPSLQALLIVDMLQVPSSGGQVFTITAQLDVLSETPLPDPALTLIPPAEAAGQLGLDFTGFLMSSEDLEQWTPVSPQPTSPWFIPIAGERRFFKALP